MCVPYLAFFDLIHIISLGIGGCYGLIFCITSSCSQSDSTSSQQAEASNEAEPVDKHHSQLLNLVNDVEGAIKRGIPLSPDPAVIVRALIPL